MTKEPMSDRRKRIRDYDNSTHNVQYWKRLCEEDRKGIAAWKEGSRSAAFSANFYKTQLAMHEKKLKTALATQARMKRKIDE